MLEHHLVVKECNSKMRTEAILNVGKNFHGWNESYRLLQLSHFSGEEIETMTGEGSCKIVHVELPFKKQIKAHS